MYLPHATLILHHSRPAARLIPAPSHQHLSNREHGTKISVQDLFGNMPVRVKQRTTGAESTREDEKQLETLKRQIVGMLLAWHSPVSVTLKNGENSKKLNIRGREMPTINARVGDTFSWKPDITLICSVLSQAGFVEPSYWDTFVKTSARTPWVSIKGAISLQPAPSKRTQFISFGIRPLDSKLGNNILYDEINRLFDLSSFGNKDDISDAEDFTMARKSTDGRFKKDGFTQKQLKGGGKGVDRWPMFYIRIDIQNTTMCFKDDVDRLGERAMSSLIKVLGAMIATFLEDNHFSPRARLARRKPERSAKALDIGRSPIAQTAGIAHEGTEAARCMYSENGFSTWSRIKVGKGSKACGDSPLLSSHSCQAKGESSTAKNKFENSIYDSQTLETSSTAVDDTVADLADEQTFEWRNPVSGATVIVNARTGLVIPPRPFRRPASAPSEKLPSASWFPRTNVVYDPHGNRRVTRSLSNPSLPPKEGLWSSELLKKWKNPIFDTTEESIPQVSFDGPTIETSDVLHGRRHCCTALDIQKAFTQASVSFSAKISKQSLNTAKVISQVDKKFILICVNDPSNLHDGENADLLVLVDQHAADERTRVEGLLADLKASPTSLPKPLVFEVQAREHPLLSRFAPSFAALGIVYDLTTPVGKAKCKITVKALPAAIAERCRLEPQVLMDLIRRESWKREEERESSLANTRSYPQGLLDMLNSRACRSAVMFNDELSMEECSTLVRRLGKCAFPFQCAHGRPSMVPLVKLGVGGSDSVGVGKRAFFMSETVGREQRDEEKGFGAAWRAWREI